MGDALDELLALLELEQLEVNLFRGLSPDEDRQRVFGGQVAAQALVAAGRTVGDDRGVHSLHAYFLRPGDPNVPIKANGALPDDPLLHACVVAYASDLTLLDTAMLPHAVSYTDDHYMIASLDHAMWFHRPFRADDWLLYHQKSPSASGARGLAEGAIFCEDGTLAVTVIQEGLMRPLASM